MPAAKRLSSVGAQYLELLTAAGQKKIKLEFAPEDYGKWKNVTMQVNNAIALFKKANPAKGEVPEELEKLRLVAIGLATELNREHGYLEIGPAREIGVGARIAEAMRHAGVKPDLSLMTSARAVSNAHEAVKRLEGSEAPATSEAEIDALLVKNPVMPVAAQSPVSGEIPNDLNALAQAMKS